MAIPPREFQRHCAWLSQNRRVLPLASAVALLDQTGKLPKGVTGLSFDDGFRTLYDHAWPIVLRHQFPITVFLVAETLAPGGRPVDWVDPPRPEKLETLSLEAILEMQQSGVRFQSHSYSHRDLASLSDGDCERDLRDSRELLEDLLGSPVNLIAYPRGSVNDRVRGAASRAGYEYGFSLCDRRQPIDSLRIPRAGIYRGEGITALRVKSSRWFQPLCSGSLAHAVSWAFRSVRKTRLRD